METILKEQAELEEQREKVSINMRNDHLQMGHIEDYILKNGKQLILRIQKTNPNDALLPQVRGIYTGQSRLTKELAIELHSAKTNNNSLLCYMGKKLGISKRISNHQARHVFAMKLFLAGHNIHHISLALGHSSLQVTENYRIKLINDNTHDVTDKFAEVLRGI